MQKITYTAKSYISENASVPAANKVQAFLGTFCAGYVLGLDDKELLALFVSSISAGICAIMNIGKYESC